MAFIVAYKGTFILSFDATLVECKSQNPGPPLLPLSRWISGGGFLALMGKLLRDRRPEMKLFPPPAEHISRGLHPKTHTNNLCDGKQQQRGRRGGTRMISLLTCWSPSHLISSLSLFVVYHVGSHVLLV